MTFNFFVRGLAVPGQYRQTKFGTIYQVGRAVAWRKAVTQEAVIAAGAGYKPLSGNVKLWLDFYFPIPKSRKELCPGMPHLQDPDCTNLLKNTEDGLKRVLFTDDCMVSKLTVSKVWCESGKEGVGVRVEITDSESKEKFLWVKFPCGLTRNKELLCPEHGDRCYYEGH